MVINPTVGVYIPIIRISTKCGMTIPNIGSLDPGTYGHLIMLIIPSNFCWVSACCLKWICSGSTAMIPFESWYHMMHWYVFVQVKYHLPINIHVCQYRRYYLQVGYTYPYHVMLLWIFLVSSHCFRTVRSVVTRGVWTWNWVFSSSKVKYPHNYRCQLRHFRGKTTVGEMCWSQVGG